MYADLPDIPGAKWNLSANTVKYTQSAYSSMTITVSLILDDKVLLEEFAYDSGFYNNLRIAIKKLTLRAEYGDLEVFYDNLPEELEPAVYGKSTVSLTGRAF